jgi:hypothetical protein
MVVVEEDGAVLHDDGPKLPVDAWHKTESIITTHERKAAAAYSGERPNNSNAPASSSTIFSQQINNMVAATKNSYVTLAPRNEGTRTTTAFATH